MVAKRLPPLPLQQNHQLQSRSKCVCGLKGYFGKLCFARDYMKSTPIGITDVNTPHLQLSILQVFQALSRIKRKAKTPDGIQFWTWIEYSVIFTQDDLPNNRRPAILSYS